MGIKKVLTAILSMSLFAFSLGVASSFSQASAHTTNESFMMFNMAEEPHKANIKVLNARIIIDAPPVFVWQTLTNYNRLKDFLPGYQKTDVVSADPNGKVLDVVMSVARFLPSYQYRLRVQENRQTYELKMNRIAGDFNHLSTIFQLYPKNNGAQTILAYTIKVDPGNNGLPKFGLGGVLKNSTESTLKAIQSKSMQEHRKSLIGQR